MKHRFTIRLCPDSYKALRSLLVKYPDTSVSQLIRKLLVDKMFVPL